MRVIFTTGLIVRWLCFSIAFLANSQNLIAQLNFEQQLAYYDSVEKSFISKTGEIIIGNNLATINVPDNFVFFDSKDAVSVIRKIWNNNDTTIILGMLIPQGISVLNDSCWSIFFSYNEDGHVSDNNAEEINYTKLLKQMQKELNTSNAERTKKGLQNIKLNTWIQEPVYNSITHKLYWATELQNTEDSIKTLNYNIRLLGRNGILVLNIIAGTDQIENVNMNVNKILNCINFNSGNRYEDFDASTDKIAPFTISGLIAGSNLPKTGRAAKVGLYIVQQWKIIAVAIVFLLTVLMLILSGRKKKI